MSRADLEVRRAYEAVGQGSLINFQDGQIRQLVNCTAHADELVRRRLTTAQPVRNVLLPGSRPATTSSPA
jgi:hypothetical protein